MTHHSAAISGATGRWIRSREGCGWIYRGDHLWYTATGSDAEGWTLTAWRYTEHGGRRRSVVNDQAVYMRAAMATLHECHATVAEHQPWLSLADAYARAKAVDQAARAGEPWRDATTVQGAPGVDGED